MCVCVLKYFCECHSTTNQIGSILNTTLHRKLQYIIKHDFTFFCHSVSLLILSENGRYGWCQLIGKLWLVIFVVNHAVVSTEFAWSQLDLMLSSSLSIEDAFLLYMCLFNYVTSYAARYMEWTTPDQQVIQGHEEIKYELVFLEDSIMT